MSRHRAPNTVLPILVVVTGLTFGWGARAEGPSGLSAPTKSLSDLTRSEPKPLGEDEEQKSGDLESLKRQDPASVEEVRQQAGPWQPPPCDLSPPADVELPKDAKAEAWQAVLDKATQRLQDAQSRLDRAEAGYTKTQTDPKDRGRRVGASKDLTAARSEYAAARCAIPGLLEAARRAGVEPGVLRSVEDQIPADLQPEEVGIGR